MNNSIKMRIKRVGRTAKVKVLIKHPMETGLRKNAKTGNMIPEHFIQEVKCKHNDNIVLDASWGIAISKNPYLSFNIENTNLGDSVILSWTDNQGQWDSATQTISQ